LPTESPTRPGALVVTEMSKLGAEPGATAIAGNGVLKVISPAADMPGAAASITSPTIDAMSAYLAVRDRTSETLDTTDTGHLLCAVISHRLPGDSRIVGARSPAGQSAGSVRPERWSNQP